MIDDQDRACVERLLDWARYDLLPLATSGQHAQAIGEFWQALEHWLQDRQASIQVNVAVGVYCKEGEPDDFMEYLHVDARVSSESIEMSTLHRVYAKETGSDHHSEVLAVLSTRQRLNASGVEKWFVLLEQVASSESQTLGVSRDHL